MCHLEIQCLLVHMTAGRLGVTQRRCWAEPRAPKEPEEREAATGMWSPELITGIGPSRDTGGRHCYQKAPEEFGLVE